MFRIPDRKKPKQKYKNPWKEQQPDEQQLTSGVRVWEAACLVGEPEEAVGLLPHRCQREHEDDDHDAVESDPWNSWHSWCSRKWSLNIHCMATVPSIC